MPAEPGPREGGHRGASGGFILPGTPLRLRSLWSPAPLEKARGGPRRPARSSHRPHGPGLPRADAVHPDEGSSRGREGAQPRRPARWEPATRPRLSPLCWPSRGRELVPRSVVSRAHGERARHWAPGEKGKCLPPHVSHSPARGVTEMVTVHTATAAPYAGCGRGQLDGASSPRHPAHS